MIEARVVEVQGRYITVRNGPGEECWQCQAGHDAGPGDLIAIYDDGRVEVRERAVRPEIIEVPSKVDGGENQQDHP